ncbi:hypothetical protein L207DRAFT_526087 [Hyaloscypha variabilis F]|uniref:Uncharacterized protein n=1 Tax=Hyaloscypha variabilis (strain UAMH 11265 / GT02V1 / F) TaxID=1149755 RepID=A0A2J6S203_HYAVF|nr:hypothetical protein L207DRAFT_526087 [Hyaloscypha variabilis F]
MPEDKTKTPKVTRWFCSPCPEHPSHLKPKGLKLMEHLNTVHQGHQNPVHVMFRCPVPTCKSVYTRNNDQFQEHMKTKHPKRHNSVPIWVFRIASSQNPGTGTSQPTNLLPGTTQSQNREKDQHHEKDKSQSKGASQASQTGIKDHSNREGIDSNSQSGVTGKDHGHGGDHSKSVAKDKPSTQQQSHQGGGGLSLSRKESLKIDKKTITSQLPGKSGGGVVRKDSVKVTRNTKGCATIPVDLHV